MDRELSPAIHYPGRDQDLAQLFLTQDNPDVFDHMPRLVGRVIRLATDNGKNFPGSMHYYTAAYHVLGLESRFHEMEDEDNNTFMTYSVGTWVPRKGSLADRLGFYAYEKHKRAKLSKFDHIRDFHSTVDQRIPAAPFYRQARLMFAAHGVTGIRTPSLRSKGKRTV